MSCILHSLLSTRGTVLLFSKLAALSVRELKGLSEGTAPIVRNTPDALLSRLAVRDSPLATYSEYSGYRLERLQ
jgi:hypothetical protein